MIGVVQGVGYEIKFDLINANVIVINNQGQRWLATPDDLIRLAVQNGLALSQGEPKP